MAEFDKQNKQLAQVEAALRKKLKSQGLNKDQIELRMLQLDVDFLIHSYVNGINPKDSTITKRLEFYISALKMYLIEK